MTAVIHADLELFFVGWLRNQLALRSEPVCSGVKVDNKEPQPNTTWPAKMVVIRYDGSSAGEIITDDAALGVTIYAGSKALPKDANDLARIVRAIISDSARVEAGNPVAAVQSSNGPIPIPDEGEKAIRYLTFELTVVGEAL
jgi:hypothetical protein